MSVFLDVAPCNLVDVYRRFRDACCLHHQVIALMMEAASISETCSESLKSHNDISCRMPVRSRVPSPKLRVNIVKMFYLRCTRNCFNLCISGSDVDWVLAGSGYVSSGSARSRGQLIAAQRIDPQTTLIPKRDSSVAPLKKGNPWTERKEFVAVGLGARARSAEEQQLTPVDPEKSAVSTRICYCIRCFELSRKVDNGWVMC
jgi:hypothetical protein